MNLKLLMKKGFTIVELVIVIAVIAILAGVLIPTFSGVVKRANLSADKQAVREMNMALAADESINGRPTSIETVMQVLANAGYNSDNWVCLTMGYEVYWYETDNRLILYNSSTAEVEYPEEYPVSLFVTAGAKLHIYNENHVKAVNYNTTIGSYSEGNSKSASELSSIASDSVSEKAALESVSSVLSSNSTSSASETIKSSLGLQSNQTAYVYATQEKRSATNANAYAALQLLSVGGTEEPTTAELQSDGKTLKTNLFYVSIVEKKGNDGNGNEVNATPQEIEAAKSAAGDMVYNIFTQVNTGQLDQDISIVFEPETEINVSGKEWAALKEFSGYFGTTDPEKPLVINGAELTAATGFSQTVQFTGSGSKYFVTGFIGSVYGETTIENVTFKNITFNEPATDFDLASVKFGQKTANSRNTIGIIGGITNGAKSIEANVTLKNIVVEDSVTMNCSASGGGLVGYIGSAEDNKNPSIGQLKGTIKIEGCHVSAKVNSNYISTDKDKPYTSGYGPVGGLIGFLCRADNVDLTIKNCRVDGEVNGTCIVGGLIGNVLSCKSISIEGNINFTGLKLNAKNSATTAAIVVYAGATELSKISVSATFTYNAETLKFNDSSRTGSIPLATATVSSGDAYVVSNAKFVKQA